MYELELDIFPELDRKKNPLFIFDTLEELLEFIPICLKNGHQIIVRQFSK